MRRNLGVVAMVVGPGNGAAQIWVVVVVFAGFRLQCRPRVRRGFGDFLGQCTEIFF
jgi:hypothetical protein